MVTSYQQARLAHIFFTILLTCKIIFCANAQAGECDTLVLGYKQELSPFRQNLVDVARASLRMQNPSDLALVHGFMEKNFKKLNEIVSAKMLGVTDPRVVDAHKKLNSISQRFFLRPQRHLSSYNVLVFLYAQLLDFLVSDLLTERLTLHDSYFPYANFEAKRSGGKVLSVLLSSEEELEATLGNDFGIFLNPGSSASFVKSAVNDWLYLPTFASLGFRTILWGASRGILFVGQSADDQLVDGRSYTPSAFSSHDYAHGLAFQSVVYDPKFGKFWDKIESSLDNSDQAPKMTKLIEGVLFLAFHEFVGYRMDCELLIPRYDQLAKEFANLMRDNNRPLSVRFQSSEDFGQAFSEAVTHREIDFAVKFALKLIQDTCSSPN